MQPMVPSGSYPMSTGQSNVLMAGWSDLQPMVGPMAPLCSGAMAAQAAEWNLHTWETKRSRPVFY